MRLEIGPSKIRVTLSPSDHPAIGKLIKQPGCRPGRRGDGDGPLYALFKSATDDGLRLYAIVGGQYMDASLKGIEDDDVSQLCAQYDD